LEPHKCITTVGSITKTKITQRQEQAQHEALKSEQKGSSISPISSKRVPPDKIVGSYSLKIKHKIGISETDLTSKTSSTVQPHYLINFTGDHLEHPLALSHGALHVQAPHLQNTMSKKSDMNDLNVR
jgi:hypothetical protein